MDQLMKGDILRWVLAVVAGVEPDDLAGTWTATAMVFTSVADPTLSVDIVAVDGAALTIVLVADATYTFAFTSPVEPSENLDGAYEVTGTTLTFSPSGTGSPEPYTLVRDGDTMTLTDAADAYVFTPQGAEESATLVITLAR